MNPVQNRGDSHPLPVSLEGVRTARTRLRGIINPTPLQISRTLGEQSGGTVRLKPECLQRTGSFKIRGAYNKVASLTPEQRARGVITYSSGNHAQAMACAAGLLGIPAVVVMPEDAVPGKVAATKGYGAEVTFAGHDSLERQARAEELQRQHGYTMIPPFDDPTIIEGQGTAGLEILEEAPDAGIVLVPCGGGGLISGIALAVRSQRPDVEVIGVEPAGGADAKASLESGRITEIDSHTICDGLRTKRIGGLNFAVMSRYVSRMVTVPDESVIEAMRLLLLRAKLVVEPSGAVAVAALMTGVVQAGGKTVVAVLSGGNAEPERITEALSG